MALALEVVRSVLSDRYRTVNAIMLLTVPLLTVAGLIVTVAYVFVPHPQTMFGALLSGAGVLLVGWIRRRFSRRGARALSADTADEPPQGSASPQES
ncbi:hypothetical protein ABZ479_41075 [Streptomyces sp. NPDC005722]